MADSDVTAPRGPSEPPREPSQKDRGARRRRLPGFLVFGIVAATIEMGIVLALLYC